jgi:hypothetical protein
MNESIELECTELEHTIKRLRKLEHATKSMKKLECAIKRTKELECVAKKMRTSTREGMISQCYMGVRYKQWALQST